MEGSEWTRHVRMKSRKKREEMAMRMEARERGRQRMRKGEEREWNGELWYDSIG